jgi:hypothetical protein
MKFWLESLKGRYNLGDLCIDGREDDIIMNFKEIGCEDVNWIRLAQDKSQWRALINTVMNLHGIY